MPASDTPAPEQLAKLPRWARDHIAWQAMRIRELEKAVAQMRAGPEGSNVLIKHYEDPDHLLGIDTPVSFRLRTADCPDGMITVSHGPGHLEVSSDSEALHITPQSSNVVRVRLGEY